MSLFLAVTILTIIAYLIVVWEDKLNESDR
jgi:hypothetical protein